MNNTPSHYDILNIPAHASDEEVKRAYHALAMQYHPDRNPQNRHRAALKFQLINEAYINLKTRDKRISYNRTLRRKRQELAAQNDNHAPGFFARINEIFRPRKQDGHSR